MKSESRIKTVFDLLLIAAFAGAICLPLLGNWAELEPEMVLQEKRKLADLPDSPKDLETFKQYPRLFDTFYNDRFGFRESLIFLHNWILAKWFPDSRNLNVIIGKEGWLYFKDRRVIDYHRGIDPFNKGQLEAWQRVFEGRKKWLKERGIKYAVFITPNKHTIYPEYLPDYIRVANDETRLDQLAAHMREHSDVMLIDTREPLLKMKDKFRLYHKTDSHWNSRGAFIAYCAVMGALTEYFDVLNPEPPARFEFFAEEGPGRDLARMLGLHEQFPEAGLKIKSKAPSPAYRIEENLPPSFVVREGVPSKNFVMERHNKRLPRVVIFRDSFFTALVNLVARKFSRSVFCWQYEFDTELVESEMPDLVIDEIQERELMNLKPFNPPQMNRGPGKIPENAIRLFDGVDFSQWTNMDGSPIKWEIEDGAMRVVPGSGSIMTKEVFRDFILHLEFRLPVLPPLAEGEDRGNRGNSGVYLLRRYEVQILDSFGVIPESFDCGALYRARPPDRNACRKPGVWQSYDIVFRAPCYMYQGDSEEPVKVKNARITVKQNGQLIHDNVYLENKTGQGRPEGPEPESILLQDHGNAVEFRNIWIVPGSNR